MEEWWKKDIIEGMAGYCVECDLYVLLCAVKEKTCCIRCSTTISINEVNSENGWKNVSQKISEKK